MKKHLLIVLLAIASMNCNSQISFENGYFINNSNQKIECQIKNLDWKNNPTEIQYRISENQDPQIARLSVIKEFEIYNSSKYIRAKVNIDRSRNKIGNLSYDKQPIFTLEELFLKVLVEGHANLYSYVDGNLERYFYNIENSDIEQLVHKSYRFSDNKIATNNQFRQQLWEDLKCESLTLTEVERLDYKKTRLINYFVKYHKCKDVEFVNYTPKQATDWLHITLRPRLNSTSVGIEKNPYGSEVTGYDHQSGFGLGVEFEVVLPFNKNKWSVLLEPTYQSFSDEKTMNVTSVSGGKLLSKINYKSIEFPIGVRYYFFLNDNSKLFLNAAFVLDLAMDSSMEISRADGSSLNDLTIKSRNNYAIGAGYKIKDTYSIELRYLTNRQLLGDYLFWKSDYRAVSLILGYTFF